LKISVAITAYEMGGYCTQYLHDNFVSLKSQTFKDFEVVVSDQSQDFDVANFCYSWLKELPIVYCREEKNNGYFTANENNAMRHCAGEIIKFLDADDYLYDKDSLEVTYNAFSEKTKWVATDYFHDINGELVNRHHPSMNDRIYICNTIGTPSCVAIRNERFPLFDENLRWAGDCEYYGQLYNMWGNPKIIDNITAVHRLWGGQVENTFGASSDLQNKENAYILAKHEEMMVQ
jgi:glycosyltransferase involved in cell wall biosynthesis